MKTEITQTETQIQSEAQTKTVLFQFSKSKISPSSKTNTKLFCANPEATNSFLSTSLDEKLVASPIRLQNTTFLWLFTRISKKTQLKRGNPTWGFQINSKQTPIKLWSLMVCTAASIYHAYFLIKHSLLQTSSVYLSCFQHAHSSV
jgi:hypothetical protein